MSALAVVVVILAIIGGLSLVVTGVMVLWAWVSASANRRRLARLFNEGLAQVEAERRRLNAEVSALLREDA